MEKKSDELNTSDLTKHLNHLMNEREKAEAKNMDDVKHNLMNEMLYWRERHR